jgi:hypothetical protein
MSGIDPYRAPAADVAAPVGPGAPARWRWAIGLVCLLQAGMAWLWIRQDGGVIDLLRNGGLSPINTLPLVASPILLVTGAILLMSRSRGATAVFVLAAVLSAAALLGSWRPLIAVVAVVISVVAAAISFKSAPRAR